MFFQTDHRLLTEAEVQTGALCDGGGRARAGYSTGWDTAIFKTQKQTKQIQPIMFETCEHIVQTVCVTLLIPDGGIFNLFTCPQTALSLGT